MTEDIFKYIDVERTIAEFGYDPKSAKAKDLVICNCPSCGLVKKQRLNRALENRDCRTCSGIKKRNAEKYEEVYSYINEEKTIEKFGYSSRSLLGESIDKVIGICPSCSKEREAAFLYFRKSMNCVSCAISKTQKALFKNKLEQRREDGYLIDIEKYKDIDVEKTIAVFGYDPRLLSEKSSKKVIVKCLSCKGDRKVRIIYALDHKSCNDCAQKKKKTPEQSLTVEELGNIDAEKTKKLLGVDVFSIKRNSKNKVICVCPICKESQPIWIATALKRKACYKCKWKVEGGIKRTLSDEGRKSLIASLKKRCGKNSPRYGKPAAHGKGSWYVKKDGKKVWMRSTWEVKYAEYLDSNGISWEIESKPFPVTYEYKGESKEGNYWPDFLVNGEWFEIKAFWRDDAKPKFEAFKAQYPDEKITLLMKPELLALGIDIK